MEKRKLKRQMKKGVGLAIIGVLFTMFGLDKEPIDETLSLVRIVLKDDENVNSHYQTSNEAE